MNSKDKKKPSAIIDRIICYSLKFSGNVKSVISYLYLVNHTSTTFITLLNATKLIEFVETTIRGLEGTYHFKDNTMKVIDIFDYKVWFIKENNQCMITLSKFKHCDVKYKNIK